MENEAGVTKIVTWQCDLCKKQYKTEAEAQECFARGFKVVFEVGQIVEGLRGAYGWYDGQDDWIVERFADPKTYDGTRYRLYYVVTSIMVDRKDPHEAAYSIDTLAVGQEEGYTFGKYLKPCESEPPASVLESAKNLVGKRNFYNFISRT